ncbi:hypothetical protein FDUTEX481_04634 [Tolypothrix sp. PCC 7601]|nr:hypothetical protein FDUTEX481_04634 [Tolypothrix sp. PCC 7601]
MNYKLPVTKFAKLHWQYKNLGLEVPQIYISCKISTQQAFYLF